MKQVAHSEERPQALAYMDKHDGNLWRYKYFTRPIIMWMAGNQGKSKKRREKERWESV